MIMDIKKVYDYDYLCLNDKIWYEKMYRYLNFVVEKIRIHRMDFIDNKLISNESIIMIYSFYFWAH
jgi:hypothetical protein